MSINEFKDYIKKLYKDRYTIDESTWIDFDTKLRMHCKVHGWFYRIPREFVQGFLCPYDSALMKKHKEWIPYAFAEKGKNKFGDRFIYYPKEYKGCKENTIITCKKHGDFVTTPDHHLGSLNGGCAKCTEESMRNKFAKSTEQFINESKKIWGDSAFDYSKTVYLNRNSRITLICKKHNIQFEQTAYKHLLHHEKCPECLRESNIERNLMETNVFVNRATVIHKGRYTYDETDTNNRRDDGKVKIKCPIHSYYWQDPQDHLAGKGCPKCAGIISKQEDLIKEYIQNNIPNIEIFQGKYGIIGRKQLDLYIPDYKLGIEFNGLHWHTEEFRNDKNYHLHKLEKANALGIKLIHIFEDEWIEHKDIVLSKIAHILKFAKTDKTIRGHKCNVKEISQLIAKPFFEKNHIQGFGQGSIIIGGFYDGELVGSCIFKKDSGNNNWELTRMATKNNYLCHGVCGKMFKYFVKKYNPNQIKSFADRRWTLSVDSNLYTALGFKLEQILPPDYRYVVGNKRIHKFNFRKERLNKKYGLPLTMTEKEMADELKIHRIWDCGLFKYVWKQ